VPWEHMGTIIPASFSCAAIFVGLIAWV